MDDNAFTGERLPCPKCKSEDNLRPRVNGTAMCFTPGCGSTKHVDGATMDRKEKVPPREFIDGGIICGLSTREIRKETCAHFGYKVHVKRKLHLAEYFDDDGMLIAQHVRPEDKRFFWTGHAATDRLWNEQNLHGGHTLIVTEGQIDAMTIWQLRQDLHNGKYAVDVASIAGGTGSAVTSVGGALRRGVFKKYKQVLFCFDNDDAGRAALAKVALLFPPGQMLSIDLPLKDANDMYVAGRLEELDKCIWHPVQKKPDGILSTAEMRARTSEKLQWGRKWPWEFMNRWTYGRRDGEVIVVGAGVGGGKTTFLYECIEHDLFVDETKIGIIMFESPVEEIWNHVAGLIDNKEYWLPDVEEDEQGNVTKINYDDADRLAAIEKIYERDHLFEVYDAQGSMDWEELEPHVRYMIASGCKQIYLDNITALMNPDNEKASVEKAMKGIISCTLGSPANTIVVSHLTTPDSGAPHERGGQVDQRHFKGSRQIAAWAHASFGIERDQQHKDPLQRRVTTIRNLKVRKNGKTTGETHKLYFNDVRYENYNEPVEQCAFDKEQTNENLFVPGFEDAA